MTVMLFLLMAGKAPQLWADETVDVTDVSKMVMEGTQSSGNIQPLQSASTGDGKMTLTFSQASGASIPGYFSSSSDIRCYANNTVTFTSNAGPIKKISINSNGSRYYPIDSKGVVMLTPDSGSFYSETADGSTVTWESETAEGAYSLTVTLKSGKNTSNQSNQLRFKNFSVVLGESGSVAEPTTYTVYFDEGDNPLWQPYVYMWDDSNFNELFGSWPGTDITQSEVNPADGKTYLKFTGSTTYSAARPMLIFNDYSSGKQTDDLSYVENGVYTWSGYSHQFGNKAPVNIPAPTISKSSCTFYDPFEVSLSLSESGCDIYYTLDGTDPSATKGTRYISPITIPIGSNVTLKAVGVNSDGDAGKIAVATYTYQKAYNLNFKLDKPSGAEIYESWGNYYNTVRGKSEWTERVPEGTQGYLSIYLNSGYSISEFKIGNETITKTYVDFTMPASDMDVVINCVYEPSSPAEPQMPVQKFNLKVVSNPVGAADPRTEIYAEGEQVWIPTRSAAKTGYSLESVLIDGEPVEDGSNSNGFYYVMPAHDVIIVRNYTYSPVNPSDPTQPLLTHPLTVVASPTGSATFYPDRGAIVNGETYTVEAYPKQGYYMRGWILNGNLVEGNSSQIFTGVMTEQGASLVALLGYDPSSPGNPGSNKFNNTTGHLVVDDFTTGSLRSAVRDALGDRSFRDIASLIVKGKMNKYDTGCLDEMENLQSLDLSRTSGYNEMSYGVLAFHPVTSVILPSCVTTIEGDTFAECSNLSVLSIYAQTPPEVTVLNYFTPANCVLRVPEESIELYAAHPVWSKFASIEPLGDAVHVLEVQLPHAYWDGKLKNNRLDLINTATGRRQRYVITDRPVYTFNGVQKDDEYLVLMTSETGLEMARIEDVLIPDADHAVAFTSIKEMVPVTASIVSPDNEDVTPMCTVEWYQIAKDGSHVYVRKGSDLGKVPEGEKLIASVTLNRDLALKYKNPDGMRVDVSADLDPVVITLEPLTATILTGKVVDEDGAPLGSASVHVAQRIAGKYDKSLVGRTDKNGEWTAAVVDAPQTVVTYSANECLNKVDTVSFDITKEVNNLGEVKMVSSVGARIRVAMSFLEAVISGETSVSSTYSDPDDITFKVYNATKERQLPVSVQYPTILVLDKDIESSDVLYVTASSISGAFLPVVQTVEAGENFRPEVSFDIIGKGGIVADYGSTDSPQVSGMLYDAAGNFVKRAVFTDQMLTLKGLADGAYTLVAMTKSDILNSAASLTVLNELGLKSGKDYVEKKVNVEHGVLSKVTFKSIPSVDESLYSYTGSNTSLTPNKSSVTSGQYLTIRTNLDFKNVYKNRVDNVRFEFTLPEGCQFIDRSMMKGSNIFGYEEVGKKIMVTCGKNYSEQLRFCVMPTTSGELGITGRVIFELDGQTVNQPLGTATAVVKDFDFFIPGRTSYPEITATGTAPANSKVSIMQDGVLVGEGKATQGGTWSVDCELVDVYNQKECQLQAIITTPDNIELTSSKRPVTFDGNAIMIDRVTMLTGSEEVIFDFNHRSNTKSYTWVDDRLFTFIVKLSENLPEKVANVTLYVQQLDGTEKAFNCYYSESRDAWLCVGNFTSSTAPINVSVSLCSASGLVFDRAQYDRKVNRLKTDIEEIENLMSQVEEVETEGDAALAASDAILSIYDDLPDLNTLTGEELTAATEAVLEAYNIEVDKSYDESLIGDEAEIDRLIREGMKLITPVEDGVDLDAIDALLANVDEYDSQEGVIADDFSFDTVVDGAEFDTAYGKMTFHEIPYSEVDIDSYDSSQISETNLDDGSKVITIVTDEVIILADESKGKAWKIDIETETTAALKAKSQFVAKMERVVEKIMEVYEDVSGKIDDLFGDIQEVVDELQDLLKSLTKESDELTKVIASNNAEIQSLDNQILKLRMQSQGANGGYKQFELTAQMKQLEARNKELLGRQKDLQKALGKVNKALSSKQAKFFIAKGVLDKVSQVAGILWKLYKAIDWARTGIEDHNRWYRFIDSILPCENDNANALNLVNDSQSYSSTLDGGYGSAAALAASSSALTAAIGALETISGPNLLAKIALKALSVVGNIISEMIYDKGCEIFDDTRNNSRLWLNQCITRRNELNCFEDPKDEFKDPIDDLPGDPKGTNKTPAGNDAEKRVAIDPAGYVYEGVHSNRVEGVQATAYYREEVEDMYGDKHLNVVLWDAETYAQENPLFTDENGMYAWDVPPGEWQVKFEKEGYNTSYSEWLPVPPPQLEVNVEITQNAQPEIMDVHAYSEGVDITFDKYMDPETLTTGNIYVTADNEKLTGSIEMLNAESVDPTGQDETARILVSKVRFVPEVPLSVTTGKVRLTINRNALSYAGIPMTEVYSQDLDIEKEIKEITLGKDLIKVLYGGDKKMTVSVLPSEAGRGRTLNVVNSSPQVAGLSVEQLTLDANGQAEFTVTGELPGSSELTFTVEGTDKSGVGNIKVLQELIEAESPTANRPSGSVLYRQEKVELTSESKDAIIYFTTDGSDPADADGTRRKYTVPITMTEDMGVKAVAVVEGETSDESVFNYTLKRNAMDFRPENGWNWISHSFETAVSPEDIAADNVKAILSQTDEVVKDDKLGLIGTLTELDAMHSYKVHAEGTATVKRVEDYAYNPATPCEIVEGWNWIGYPVDQEMTVEEAFAGCDFSAEDIIVGQDGSSQYDGEKWVGTLTTLKPGAGYMLNVKEGMDLAYNNSIVSNANAKNAVGVTYKAPWAADKRKYAKAMVLVADVCDDRGVLAEDNEWYVGAFSGSECRGVGRWVDGMVMMNIFGQTGDEITLHLMAPDSDLETIVPETLSFGETVVGSVINPYRINVKSNSVASVSSIANGSVAVVNGQLIATPCDLLEIYDAAGVKVLSIVNYDGSAIALDALSAGVHVVAVRDGENYSYAKIMVK